MFPAILRMKYYLTQGNDYSHTEPGLPVGMSKLYQRALISDRNLLTHENGDFGAVSVMN